MSKEKQTAEEWTKEVSPTKYGLREQLKSTGLLKHTHEWMERYANQQTFGKDKEIDELKKENYNLLCERIECVSQAEEYKSMYANLKQIADEMAIELNLVLNNIVNHREINNMILTYKHLTNKP